MRSKCTSWSTVMWKLAMTKEMESDRSYTRWQQEPLSVKLPSYLTLKGRRMWLRWTTALSGVSIVLSSRRLCRTQMKRNTSIGTAASKMLQLAQTLGRRSFAAFLFYATCLIMKSQKSLMSLIGKLIRRTSTLCAKALKARPSTLLSRENARFISLTRRRTNKCSSASWQLELTLAKRPWWTRLIQIKGPE